MARVAPETASAIVSGFAGAPALLLIVLLNISAIAGGMYYLIQTDKLRNERALELASLLRACINKNMDFTDGQFHGRQ